MGKVVFDMSMSLDGFVKGTSADSRRRSSPDRPPMSQLAGQSRLQVESQFWDKEGEVMRVFVAGGVGVAGKRPPRARREGATR